MVAVVILLLGLATLGLLLFVARFIAALILLVLCSVVVLAVSAYLFSFLGLYFILGDGNIGAAIFGSMLLGSIIVSVLIKKTKQLVCKTGSDCRQYL